MDCIRCHGEAGYNRVVVDWDTREELGGFCSGCERELFGSRLKLLQTKAETECQFCSGDGVVVLPRWTEQQADGNQVVVEYKLTSNALFICEQHYQQLCTE